MTPAQTAKRYGLKTLAEAARLSGFPVSTLRDMQKRHPRRFEAVCRGAIAMRTDP